jgi:hypothetical protein
LNFFLIIRLYDQGLNEMLKTQHSLRDYYNLRFEFERFHNSVYLDDYIFKVLFISSKSKILMNSHCWLNFIARNFSWKLVISIVNIVHYYKLIYFEKKEWFKNSFKKSIKSYCKLKLTRTIMFSKINSSSFRYLIICKKLAHLKICL